MQVALSKIPGTTHSFECESSRTRTSVPGTGSLDVEHRPDPIRDTGGPLKRTRSLAVAGALAVSSLTGAGAALAADYDNMYPTGNYPGPCGGGTMEAAGFCLTDSRGITAFRKYGHFAQSGLDNIQSSLNRYIDGTVLSYYFVGVDGVVYSGAEQTDIVYDVGTVPGNLLGITSCNHAADSVSCDQHFVRFPANAPSTNTTCHETGHAVGLTHGQEAWPSISNHDDRLQCMTTQPIEVNTVGPNNKGWINATY